MTKINIGDAGTSSSAVVDGGKMTVEFCGGCPVERIIGHIDYSEDRSLQSIADDVLAAWMEGYYGDAHESGLAVKITRGEESVEVSA